MTGFSNLHFAVFVAALLCLIVGARILDNRLPLPNLFRRIARRLFPPSETIEGYEHPEVVETVFRKTLAYRTERVWPEIQGASTVLDFGGGCGLHYKEAQSETVKWAVVDTPAMVKQASELATDRLRFFSSIPEAKKWLGHVDVIHSDGALQFTDEPHRTVEQLCALKAPTMLWYRMYLSKKETEKVMQTSHLVDNGPGRASLGIKNKAVKYPYTRIPEADFLSMHEKNYDLETRGEDWFRFSLKPL